MNRRSLSSSGSLGSNFGVPPFPDLSGGSGCGVPAHGFEPRFRDSKSLVLPLDDAGGREFPCEPLNSGARFGVNRARAIQEGQDRKSTRLNSSHSQISYAVFCLKKKIKHKK